MEKPKHEMEFIREQTNFLNELPEYHKESLLFYTSSMYTKINNYLQGDLHNIDEMEVMIIDDIINSIDKAFSIAPKLKHPLTLYRGLDMPNIKNKRYTKPIPLHGLQGKYKGYMSGSTRPNIAANFVRNECCLLKITIPKGTRVIYMSPISQFSYENEVLLPRDSIINITGYDDYFSPDNKYLRKIVKTTYIKED